MTNSANRRAMFMRREKRKQFQESHYSSGRRNGCNMRSRTCCVVRPPDPVLIHAPLVEAVDETHVEEGAPRYQSGGVDPACKQDIRLLHYITLLTGYCTTLHYHPVIALHYTMELYTMYIHSGHVNNHVSSSNVFFILNLTSAGSQFISAFQISIGLLKRYQSDSDIPDSLLIM